MFMVSLTYGDDLVVSADDYEVDEDGDLVFLAEGDEEVSEVDENGMIEVGRVQAHAWAAVIEVSDEDEDDDFDGE